MWRNRSIFGVFSPSVLTYVSIQLALKSIITDQLITSVKYAILKGNQPTLQNIPCLSNSDEKVNCTFQYTDFCLFAHA